MNGDLRVGLIGCGNVALRAHAPALLDVPGVRVVGVADPVAARREQVLALLGQPEARGYDDYRALLDAGVDYVTLTVPQRFRRPIVEDCAQAGVHVLSEKPIATTPADAAAMAAAMEAAGLRFGMVHNYVYFPEYVQARELIEAGAIGRLRHVLLNFMGMPDNPGAAEYRPAWRHDAFEAGGGVLMDMVHVIYMAEFFFGSPVRSVSAVIDNLDHPGDSVEDFTLVNYGFDEGYATVHMWWGEGPGGLEIAGTRGRILAFYEDYKTGPFTVLESMTLVNEQGRRALNPRESQTMHHTFARLHSDFVEAIRDGRPPMAPAEAGLRVLEAALGAYASAACGQVMALPLDRGSALFQQGLPGLAELPAWPGSPLRRRHILGL